MDETKVIKKKVGLYLDDSTYLEVKNSYHKDGCRSLTEFMEGLIIQILSYKICPERFASGIFVFQFVIGCECYNLLK